MVSHLFFYQLVLITLVWLCLMLQWMWPSAAAPCPTPPEQGSGQNHVHAEHGMNMIMWSSRSCRAVCADLDVATVFYVLARHDSEVRRPWSTV
jgi:hypothetical protein